PAKAVLKFEPTSETEPVAETAIRSAAPLPGKNSQRFPNALAVNEPPNPTVLPVANMSPAVPIARPRRNHNSFNFQSRVPVIIGEACFRGLMPVDGIISGHLGANGSSLAIKQRPHCGSVQSEPELTGEISFKD